MVRWIQNHDCDGLDDGGSRAEHDIIFVYHTQQIKLNLSISTENLIFLFKSFSRRSIIARNIKMPASAGAKEEGEILYKGVQRGPAGPVAIGTYGARSDGPGEGACVHACL